VGFASEGRSFAIKNGGQTVPSFILSFLLKKTAKNRIFSLLFCCL